ncbi:MAG: nucleoside 2-deoxyribosyltransferase [Patescibacteria group bacterium]
MKIYFTAPIKRGRAHQPEFKTIVSVLERYGTVHAPHMGAVSFHGETAMPDREILERELAALAAADVVVAEVTTPGLGVGYLLAQASNADKKVIALYRDDNTLKLSSIIKGDPKITVLTYKNEENIEPLIVEALK